MIDKQITNITYILSLFYFYYYHYHHRYHYSYHNFITTILCYVPSVITCTVGGAIQMTVLHYIYITLQRLKKSSAFEGKRVCTPRENAGYACVVHSASVA